VSGSWDIVATGAVSPAGVGTRALVDALHDEAWAPQLGFDDPRGRSLAVARPPGFAAKNHIPPLVARRLDRCAGLLAVAAREALASAGSPPPWPGDRIGVCAATWNAGTEALVEVLKAVFLASPDESPPAQFPSTVANAPASQLGILEKLAGPNVTFFEKQVGGLRALGEAARMIAHGRADAVVACGVDEAQWLNAEGYGRLRALRRPGRPGMVLAEGASVLLLAAPGHPGAVCRLAGFASAGSPAPTHLYPSAAAAVDLACRQALARAGAEAGDVELYVSFANGIPALDRLEAQLVDGLFPLRRPAAISVTERMGEGAFGSSVRTLAAALALRGEVLPRWALPRHLRDRGFSLPPRRPATALVAGVSGGGSTLAVVLTAS
jgi:3-oxoacyl-(acyl-carrier-protein) synthase